jgi:hypothetical protein
LAERNPKLAAEVGQRHLSNHLYVSAENSMTSARRNRRGIFGSRMRKVGILFLPRMNANETLICVYPRSSAA